MADKDNLKEKKSKKRLKDSDAVAAAAVSVSTLSVDAPANAAQRIDVSQCPLQTVVVYSDRAELTRRVSVSLARGTSEVVVYGISAHVDDASVRVSGAVGNATILEVKPSIKPRAKDDKKDPEHEKKALALKELVKRRSQLQEQNSIVEEEGQWLQAYASSLNATGSPKSEPTAKNRLTFAEAADFLRFYAEQRTALSARKEEIAKKLEELEEQMREIERSRDKAQQLLRKAVSGGTDQCEVSIVLEVHDATDAQLNLSYILRNAKWEPLYDIRVTTSTTQVQLTYLGNIYNRTGEDWNDVRVSLSTAAPSIGGTPPKMPTIFVQQAVRRVPPPYSYSASRANSMAASPVNPMYGNAAPMMQTFAAPRSSRKPVGPPVPTNTFAPASSPRGGEEEEGGGGGGGGGGEEAAPMGVLTSTVDVKASSANFTINRKATVGSDGEAHRVTVAVLTFNARFQYTIVPKLSQNAYMRATCDNTSDYPLLEGKLSVFQDGNFVTTSHLKSVNPGEEFFVHLGVDSSVQVDFKPPKCVTSTSGVLSRVTREEHKYLTVVKNSKDFEVSLLVFMQLPKSENDKIKVKPLEPIPKEGDTDLMINEFNNMRWQFKLGPKKDRNIRFEYAVEYSADMEIEYK